MPPAGRHPTASPAQRVAVGSEKQQNERAMSFVLKGKNSSQAICRLRRAGAAGGIRTHVRLPAN